VDQDHVGELYAFIHRSGAGRIRKISASRVGPSVADPDPSPDPKNPYVFGPSGSASGSISQRYGSESGSFYHQAKLVRKTLIPTVL
jgi:hypothetical protein